VIVLASDNEKKSDVDLYNTLRLMRCSKCGNVFVTSISGYVECPECSSVDATGFHPDEDIDK
jgi:hypothetical protein